MKLEKIKSFVNRLRDVDMYRVAIGCYNRDKTASRDFQKEIVAMVYEKNG